MDSGGGNSWSEDVKDRTADNGGRCGNGHGNGNGNGNDGGPRPAAELAEWPSEESRREADRAPVGIRPEAVQSADKAPGDIDAAVAAPAATAAAG
ncbi:hypothetical protein SPI_05728 [Niveomyces insectorum RCEF 264]|uniref:Uncharacterized protein n=1 Tax=Niveomyces insectorum RCEF 264 TaxID=1081102 RepID=A0A167SDR9_9HYPO|nr:hypothetical protein SPI_05728 [Niveomyces insectorum RCEF 264]